MYKCGVAWTCSRCVGDGGTVWISVPWAPPLGCNLTFPCPPHTWHGACVEPPGCSSRFCTVGVCSDCRREEVGARRRWGT